MRRIIWVWTIGWVAAVTAWGDFTKEQASRVSQLVGKVLERAHYRQAPLDDAMSEQFLKNYFEALDYFHIIFLQSDLDEFNSRYGTRLDDLTRRGDITPAFEIFDRYMTRLTERHAFIQQILQRPMDFSVEETFDRQRNKAPWPQDNAQAEELWRKRVKLDLLQDRLAKAKAAKAAEAKKAEKAASPSSSTDTAPTAPPPAAAKEPKPSASKDPLSDPIKTISKRYDRLLKTNREYETEDILQIYLSALSRAYDPHTDYLSPTEASDFDINHIKLKLSGIGARLRWEDGFTKVESLVPGGPAALSKQIKPNDRIIAVAQAEGEPVDVVEMKLRKVVELIRGPVGTEVNLTIIPGDDPDGAGRKLVTLTRDEIKIAESFAKARVVELSDDRGSTRRLGVISLPQFYERCARDVAKLIERLQKEGVTGLVLDLRHNGGGLLDQAVELTGLFIPQGPVVQVRDNRRTNQVYVDDDEKVAYSGPLVVLVDHQSASASEITAAALQDYGRAIVVGDSNTHGKGTVQQVVSLDRMLNASTLGDPGKLKLTISKFYRIAGGTTQKHGVTPDIILPSLYEHMEIGEAHLPNCLPADDTTPLQYERFDKVHAYLTQLRSNSAVRMAKDRDFAYLQEDIQRLRKQIDEKTISLSETQHLKDQDEDEARRKTRLEERNKRAPSGEKVYAVSLEMVDQNKPLELAKAMKVNEEDQLASKSDATSEEEDEDATAATEGKVDYRLGETFHILLNYIDALAKTGDNVVANTPSAAQPRSTTR